MNPTEIKKAMDILQSKKQVVLTTDQPVYKRKDLKSIVIFKKKSDTRYELWNGIKGQTGNEVKINNFVTLEDVESFMKKLNLYSSSKESASIKESADKKLSNKVYIAEFPEYGSTKTLEVRTDGGEKSVKQMIHHSRGVPESDIKIKSTKNSDGYLPSGMYEDPSKVTHKEFERQLKSTYSFVEKLELKTPVDENKLELIKLIKESYQEILNEESTEYLKNKKITLATLKTFIKKNENNLYVNIESSFDGMIDGVRPYNDGFKKAVKDEPVVRDGKSYDNNDHTLGYKGIWCVGQSRDYFEYYENKEYAGIEVSNACGNFIVAIKK